MFKKNQKKLIKKWKSISVINQERLSAFKKLSQIKDTRFKGTMAAIQKRDSEGYNSSFAETATKKALKQGVFLRPLGGTVYILPPYCITTEELHKIWDVIESLF